MIRRPLMKAFPTVAAALVLAVAGAGCTTNNYNCNVKDACRTSGEAAR